jgi:putative addiction module antidote
MKSQSNELTVRAIGSSSGVILPKGTLERLGVERGQKLIATEVPGGLMLVPANSRLGRLMAQADAYMDEHNATFRELAR